MCMHGRSDAMSHGDALMIAANDLRSSRSRVGGRKHDLNFKADRIGVRCDDCAAMLTNCLKSNRQSETGAIVCPWTAIWFLYPEEWSEDLLQ